MSGGSVSLSGGGLAGLGSQFLGMLPPGSPSLLGPIAGWPGLPSGGMRPAGPGFVELPQPAAPMPVLPSAGPVQTLPAIIPPGYRPPTPLTPLPYYPGSDPGGHQLMSATIGGGSLSLPAAGLSSPKYQLLPEIIPPGGKAPVVIEALPYNPANAPPVIIVAYGDHKPGLPGMPSPGGAMPNAPGLPGLPGTGGMQTPGPPKKPEAPPTGVDHTRPPAPPPVRNWWDAILDGFGEIHSGAQHTRADDSRQLGFGNSTIQNWDMSRAMAAGDMQMLAQVAIMFEGAAPGFASPSGWAQLARQQGFVWDKGLRAFKDPKTGKVVEAIPKNGKMVRPPGSPATRPTLPAFRAGGKTSGVLRTPTGDIPLQSGRAGPASSIPKGTAGFDAYTRTHVEGHAAALMRQQGLTEATVYINNPTICPNCSRLLPRMLPPGARLNVVLPDGTVVPFVGR
jgi:hypothetical protein